MAVQGETNGPFKTDNLSGPIWTKLTAPAKRMINRTKILFAKPVSNLFVIPLSFTSRALPRNQTLKFRSVSCIKRL